MIRKYSQPKSLKKNQFAQWVQNTSIKNTKYGLQIPSICNPYKEVCLTCTPKPSTSTSISTSDPIHHIQCDDCIKKLQMDVDKNNESKPLDLVKRNMHVLCVKKHSLNQVP